MIFSITTVLQKSKMTLKTSLTTKCIITRLLLLNSFHFRNLIRSDLNQNSWGSFGIDIALGSKIDQIASVEEHMFLPKYLHQLLENARLKTDDSRLVTASKTLNPSDAYRTK